MIVVIGSGAAGISAALEAKSSGGSVTLITKGDLSESNTDKAQGGVAVAMLEGDSPDSHVRDTLSVGVGLNNDEVVRSIIHEGPKAINQLIKEFGAAFDRNEDGTLAHGLEAAHSFPRILHGGGDATGHTIEVSLVAAIRKTDIRIKERTVALDILTGLDPVTNERGVTGVRYAENGQVHDMDADIVILACGGVGEIYSATTNPECATGDGVALAWRAGAGIADSEFVQFHPTVLAGDDPFLISEAVRGQGAILTDQNGERFMLKRHPLAELAPRDVVARENAAVIAEQNGKPVLLHADAIIPPHGEDLESFLRRRFPTISQACHEHGLDWAHEPIPIAPACHYWMGGVATDDKGRSDIVGLYAAGEVACTGLHGANRLASNSLLEALVVGRRAGHDAVVSGREGWREKSESKIFSDAERVGFPEKNVKIGTELQKNTSFVSLRREIQEATSRDLGVVRDRKGLMCLLERLISLENLAETAQCDARKSGNQKMLCHAAEDINIITVAELITYGALLRKESRGAHFRSDYPDTDSVQAHSRILDPTIACGLNISSVVAA